MSSDFDFDSPSFDLQGEGCGWVSGVGFKRVGRIIVGCASLASPVLHQPVEPGSPADPDSLREISPPKMFAQLFPVRTSDNRMFMCEVSSDRG